MKKNPKFFLTHILESINEIENYLRGFSKEKFLKDSKTQNAVVRNLEIVGEATRNLPAEFKRKYPDIPWRKISGTRDKLIHQYFDVDLEIVWNTVNEDLPKLEMNL